MLEANYICEDVFKSHVRKMKYAFEFRIANTPIMFHLLARRVASATPLWRCPDL